MNEDAILSSLEVDPRNIRRAISPVVSELGNLSAAILLYATVYQLTHREGAVRLAEKFAEHFPIYGEIVDLGHSPAEIESIIERNVEALSKELKSFSSLVVVGMEAVLLDSLSRELPGAGFYLIPHSEDFDEGRLLANFPPNVQLIDVREVMSLGGVNSALLSYVFCQTQEDGFVYPVALRSIGPDVRSSYSQIIGLNIFSGYRRYLSDMTPLHSTSLFFTHQFRLL